MQFCDARQQCDSDHTAPPFCRHASQSRFKHGLCLLCNAANPRQRAGLSPRRGRRTPVTRIAYRADPAKPIGRRVGRCHCNLQRSLALAALAFAQRATLPQYETWAKSGQAGECPYYTDDWSMLRFWRTRYRQSPLDMQFGFATAIATNPSQTAWFMTDPTCCQGNLRVCDGGVFRGRSLIETMADRLRTSRNSFLQLFHIHPRCSTGHALSQVCH